MIDPLTAFATAQAAVAGIQKAIKLGKDIQGLVGEFGKFFDAKDAVIKAANDAAKSGKSDTAQAMEFVMQQNQLREAEEHLKHTLIYTGYPELWEQMLAKRMEIQRERRRAEEAARKERARVVAQRILIAQIIGASITVIILAALVIYIVRQATE
jgi:hypothetical protein